VYDSYVSAHTCVRLVTTRGMLALSGVDFVTCAGENSGSRPSTSGSGGNNSTTSLPAANRETGGSFFKSFEVRTDTHTCTRVSSSRSQRTFGGDDKKGATAGGSAGSGATSGSLVDKLNVFKSSNAPTMTAGGATSSTTTTTTPGNSSVLDRFKFTL
jgi:hypothetical protein